MEKGVLSWGGGASVGEVSLGKSFQQDPGSLGGVKVYFSLLPGKKGQGSMAGLPWGFTPPWVFNPQAGILDSSGLAEATV